MTAHISCRSLTQFGLQIPRWRTKWYRNNRTIQNSIEFKASAYILHAIRQMAALVDHSRNKTRKQRQEILNIRQVAALSFATLVVGCICAYVVVLVWLVFVQMCVKRSCLRCMVVKMNVWVTSMEIFVVVSHLLSILHFAVWQLLCWPFLLFMW